MLAASWMVRTGGKPSVGEISRGDGARWAIVLLSLVLGLWGWARSSSHSDSSASGPTGAATESPRLLVVDPNRATPAELSLLPGIGPTLARRIVEHREHVGPFHSPADLQLVRGLGERKLAEIAPYLTPATPVPRPIDL